MNKFEFWCMGGAEFKFGIYVVVLNHLFEFDRWSKVLTINGWTVIDQATSLDIPNKDTLVSEVCNYRNTDRGWQSELVSGSEILVGILNNLLLRTVSEPNDEFDLIVSQFYVRRWPVPRLTSS